MARRLNVHANGGYDVTDMVGGKEVVVEFTEFALNPVELEKLLKIHRDLGHEVYDHRSAEKLALADQAREAIESMWEMYASQSLGAHVEKEALERAACYAHQTMQKAVESAC